MAQRLKRWESPRRKGRNHKGRGGSARHRQIVKQQQLWRKRLKSDDKSGKSTENRRGDIASPVFFMFF
ncbi:MAG: hypothetical protein AAGC54_18085 [Cyanobacteria bacterium P01_F01_bin.4]